MKIIFPCLVLLTISVFGAGCASTSKVLFAEPPGAKLELRNETYTFPVVLDLRQNANPGEAMRRHDGEAVRIILNDGTQIRGYLHVFKIELDQVEELAEVRFSLSEEQISKLKEGQAVMVTGYSARRRPVYTINLGVER